MRGWFEPKGPAAPPPLATEDRRQALEFAYMFHQGKGDHAAELYALTEDPLRLTVTLADLLGALIRDLALATDIPEPDMWREMFVGIETAVPFVRKAYE